MQSMSAFGRGKAAMLRRAVYALLRESEEADVILQIALSAAQHSFLRVLKMGRSAHWKTPGGKLASAARESCGGSLQT
jgi:hypothetical protein